MLSVTVNWTKEEGPIYKKLPAQLWDLVAPRVIIFRIKSTKTPSYDVVSFTVKVSETSGYPFLPQTLIYNLYIFATL